MREILTPNHTQNIKRWGEQSNKAIRSLTSFLLLGEIKGSELGIDSYCFQCTKTHLNRFLKQYQPKPYTPSREGRFFTLKDQNKAQKRELDLRCYKIGGIRLITYSTSHLFEEMRSHHKRLDQWMIVELHGFSQYAKNAEKKPLSPLASKIGEYFLKTPKFSKLKALDCTIDFKEKMPITYQAVIEKFPKLQTLDQPHTQTYKTTLYLQKHAPRFGNQDPLCVFENGALQRVCIYDKQKKNALDHPLTRFEFRILLEDLG